ncbi:MAG: class I SAM-dependent methyltransferase [Promethearchaeota archaeon]
MFDDIASDWNNKRKHPWTPFVNLLTPLISQWKHSYPSSDPNHLLFVDLGAGSGRHSEFLSQHCHRLVELDQSRPMLRKNGSSSEKLQADLTALPFRPESVDGLLAIASLHHVAKQAIREEVISTMDSIVRDRGFVCITVWRFRQKKFMDIYRDHLERSSFTSQGSLTGLNSLTHLDSSSRLDSSSHLETSSNVAIEIGDVEVPWKLSQKSGTITVQRFYHLFRAVEFRKLMRRFSQRHFYSFGSGDKKNKKINKNNFFFFGLRQALK